MAIHLYALCWNEVDMLGFFFRHYDAWIDHYVIYDDGSTDGSLDLLQQHPKVEVRQFTRVHKDSFVLSEQIWSNTAWKESRSKADWVVVTTLDEHLHVKGRSVASYLDDCKQKGITLIPALGYQMISDEYPQAGEWLCETRTLGAPLSFINKLGIFNPDALAETGFGVGRHISEPCGNLRLPRRDELMLLHYRYLNFERSFRGHQKESQGLGSTDINHGWGSHYLWSEQEFRQKWMKFKAAAIDIGKADFRPWRMHGSPRWWRWGFGDARWQIRNLSFAKFSNQRRLKVV